ncbi:Fungal transcriptional regulatory protein [Cordyceps javanica]|uniref:Fungal transcriptional regulatory protein n=1 Tax=Cordyceps javanica TaxID=43265 RepID=A0A545W6I8_9HYPO|nr:Fungal transcriptional regulatory protein [Cordyceps javanica]TQW09576.1 Fungal transcriptional regulatory protein [Cordyceps javanica]
MSASPPPPPSPHTTAHAYASNGLEILQAASDAAQAIQNSEALQHAAAQAVGQQGVAHLGPGAEMPSPHMVSGQGAMMRDPTINPKLTRLRRACDMCSMRKVKCDDSNIPCRPCRELNVDCTYNRETKRRGPPNKHAEAAKAAKKARAEGQASGFTASPSPQIAAKTLLTISSDAVLDAESIAPMPVLELLVDDFFTYIHPLAPFPHEPTFRQSFANREDRTRPEFLGLLSSMIGALVASFPRCVREHLKSQHSTHLFPKASVMVDKCRDIALHTRGARWPIKQPKTLDDAMTSYFLGLGAAYTIQYNVARVFLSETLTLIRELGFTRPKHHGEQPNFGLETFANEPLPFNHVKDQIGKRIFWCLLLGNRSLFQLTSHNDMVIAPSTPNLPYPAYPENVDDICIQANEVIHQADGTVTLLTGFRIAIDIYTTMNGIVSLELAYGMSTLPWADQRILLRDGLMAAKSIIDNLPPELQLGSSSAEANPLASLDESGMQYVPPVWPDVQPSHDLRNVIKAHPVRRRQLQYEIQKANIFVSQLATRSYFVELYFDLRDIHLTEHPDSAEGRPEDSKALVHDGDDKEIYELMSTERELIVQNLLVVLGCISQRNLEPNGRSLVEKIRQVASTLLNDAPHRKGPLAVKSEEALSQLIEILMKLEKTGPAGETRNGGDPHLMTAEDEEAELRHWADLREYQLRFAAAGGFNGAL